MEKCKVYWYSSSNNSEDELAEEINEMLLEGWKSKSVTTMHVKEDRGIVIVIYEKPDKNEDNNDF